MLIQYENLYLWFQFSILQGLMGLFSVFAARRCFCQCLTSEIRLNIHIMDIIFYLMFKDVLCKFEENDIEESLSLILLYTKTISSLILNI